MSRIVAGSRRGHRLTMPPGAGTRPTSDRVREAIFQVLVSERGRTGDPAESLQGLAFLDLYAGSGAVGLEAASRGAAPVVGVEQDRRAADVARRNARETGLGVKMVAAGVGKYLAGPPQPFDIAWLDPPYDVPNEVVTDVLHRLVDAAWLAPEALVAVERSSRTAPFAWPEGLGDPWQRRYGETTIHLASTGAR